MHHSASALAVTDQEVGVVTAAARAMAFVGILVGEVAGGH
jgi:hypothetical protein